MADAVPNLSLLEEETPLVTKQEDIRNTRRSNFIVKMTSGVVYSIAMYSLIIATYVYTVFHISGHLNVMNFIMKPFFISLYLLLCGVEVVSRWLYAWSPLFYTQFGQSYLVFLICMMQADNKVSRNSIERGIAIILMNWTAYVSFKHFLSVFVYR